MVTKKLVQEKNTVKFIFVISVFWSGFCFTSFTFSFFVFLFVFFFTFSLLLGTQKLVAQSMFYQFS